MDAVKAISKENSSQNSFLNKLPHKKTHRLEISEEEINELHKLNLLKIMLKNQGVQHLEEDIFLLSFLRAKNFNLDRALRSIKAFYSAKSHYKEIFTDAQASDSIRIYSDMSMGYLPFRDDAGCLLLYIKLESWDPSKHSFGHLLSALMLGLLHTVQSPSNQTAKIKVIIDTKGFGFRKLSYFTPRYVKLFAEGLQSASPASFPALYFVNANIIASYIWSIFKHVLSKKMQSRFQFCGKDMKQFHKFISPKLLPKELGGDLPPYDNTDWVKSFAQNAEYINRILQS